MKVCKQDWFSAQMTKVSTKDWTVNALFASRNGWCRRSWGDRNGWWSVSWQPGHHPKSLWQTHKMVAASLGTGICHLPSAHVREGNGHGFCPPCQEKYKFNGEIIKYITSLEINCHTLILYLSTWALGLLVALEKTVMSWFVLVYSLRDLKLVQDSLCSWSGSGS